MGRLIWLREFPGDLDVEHTPPDAYVAERPTLEQKPYRLRTDANGLIRSGLEHSGSFDTVIAVGDSVGECLFVEEDKRIWSELSRLCTCAGHPVEVLNGCVSNNHLLHIINMVLNKIVPLRPSAILFFGGTCDYIPAGDVDSYWSTARDITTIHSRSSPDAGVARPLDLRDMHRLVNVLADACLSFDIAPIFFTVPHRNEPDVLYYEYVRKTNAEIRSLCVGRGLPFVDLERELLIYEEDTNDHIHLNARGCAKVARAMFESAVIATALKRGRKHIAAGPGVQVREISSKEYQMEQGAG